MAGPHDGLPVRVAGAALDGAAAGMVLLHGRGASAADILLTAELFAQPGWALLAPEAAGDTWYPNPFTAPLADNEPHLASALDRVRACVERLESRLPAERIVLLGFSQGACLALEFAARNPRRYGAVVGLSGGLIGQADERAEVRGTLAGTPVLLACGEHDPYIPAVRVRAAADVLRRLGGDVRLRLDPDLGHEVSAAEAALVRELMAAVSGRDQSRVGATRTGGKGS